MAALLEGTLHVEWWSIIPFVVLLGCIAVLPLLRATEHAWERNSTKLTVALALGLPVAAWVILAGSPGSVVHALVEYAQFITLLFSLFVVSGGIFLAGDIRATPATTRSSSRSAVSRPPSSAPPVPPCC